jgi:hypothetical protein
LISRAKTSWTIGGLIVLVGALATLGGAWDFVGKVWLATAPLFSKEVKRPFTLKDKIFLVGAPDLPAGSVTVKVLWVKGAGRSLDDVYQSPEYARMDSEPTSGSFALPLQSEPPTEVLRREQSPSKSFSVEYGLGAIVAFLDTGNDGFFNAGTDKLLAIRDGNISWHRILATKAILEGKELPPKEESEEFRELFKTSGSYVTGAKV